MDGWTDVLARVAVSDPENEADALFAAQQVWSAIPTCLTCTRGLTRMAVVDYSCGMGCGVACWY